MNKHHPYHPIIYVRGFAATSSEIEETVADPYMGFNLGSTKTRQYWNGKMQKFFFESPLVRLKDERIWLTDAQGERQKTASRYDDVYVNGVDLSAPSPDDPTKPAQTDMALPYQSIVIFRYYDEASQAFGTGDTPPIEHFARELSHLIFRLRALVCRTGPHPITGEHVDNGVDPKDFKVHLVAHSMGGLVCRAFLQKEGAPEARKAVDKLFTYATPHNGIDLRIVRNVPGWATFGDVNNFNRLKIADYFGLKVPPNAKPETLDVSLLEHFPPERVFNLVGTNPADYLVMKGLSSWAAGDRSDGLVRAENATTHGIVDGKDVQSPRAYAHRSHSGHYGIVNSEEGYQNLTRFLFGTLRADGILDVDNVILPDEIEKLRVSGKQVRASYQFEICVSVRGTQWNMHRRTVRENSAILRTYDELFPRPNRTPDRSKSPHLFSAFLDGNKSTTGDTIAFLFDLRVLVPDYEVDGMLQLKQHFEGGHIYRESIVVEAKKGAQGGFSLMYGLESITPNAAPNPLPSTPLPDGTGFSCTIPIDRPTKPGINGKLRIEVRPWN